MRTCVGCRARRSPDQLVRCALGPDGVVRVHRSAPGRGAWVCQASRSCVERALARRGFERAWRRPLPLGAEAHLRAALLGETGTDDVSGASLTMTNDEMEDLLTAGATRRPAGATKD